MNKQSGSFKIAKVWFLSAVILVKDLFLTALSMVFVSLLQKIAKCCVRSAKSRSKRFVLVHSYFVKNREKNSLYVRSLAFQNEGVATSIGFSIHLWTLMSLLDLAKTHHHQK